MKRFVVLVASFFMAFVIGFQVASFFAEETQAKPNMCILAVEPYYYCEPSNSCHNPGEQRCWLCLGHDVYGEPCLCSRVGCMVPPE